MPRVVWTRAALGDLGRLHAFLHRVNPPAARRAVNAIRRGTALLGTHPALGHAVDGLPPEFREWLIGFGASAYVVRYRPDRDAVVILAVRHGREAGH